MSLVIAPTLAFSRKGRALSTIPVPSGNKVILVDKKMIAKTPIGGANKNRFHGNGPKHVHDMTATDLGVKSLEAIAKYKYAYDHDTARKVLVGYPEMGETTNMKLRILSQL